MRIHRLSFLDEVHRYQKSIVVHFTGPRKVLSTAHINGGYREDLKAVYNYDANPGAGMACTMRGNSVYEHMLDITKELELCPETTAGISTAASMDNVAIVTETFEDLTVTAIVTGGVEVNGGRVGDYASYHEKAGKAVPVKEGTINILLFVDADLPEETMARALVTCTEAKTAALQELMAGSNYSSGLATGSGTDGTIICCNSSSAQQLVYAGKHSKLGELIGKTVKPAVKEALYLQTGLSPSYQHSLLKRLKRYGVTVDSLWSRFVYHNGKQCLTKAAFVHQLETVDNLPYGVTVVSLFVHLLDQYEWGLLEKEQVINGSKQLIQNLMNYLRVAHGEQIVINKADLVQDEEHIPDDEVIDYLLEVYEETLVAFLGGLCHG